MTSIHDDFSHLDSDDPAAALFNRAMAELTAGVADAAASALDMRGVRRVVDVGGGWGQLLCRVLLRHADVQGVLFDMAHATQAMPEQMRAAGVAGRCELAAGSFFEAVPEGANLYLLKSILHDWDDARCSAILRNCRRAMHPGAHMVVIERVAAERVLLLAGGFSAIEAAPM